MDGRTSTYSNILTVNQDLEATAGRYECTVRAISLATAGSEEEIVEGQCPIS